ncbi:MAG: prohibitin family protein [Anaerolineales bacterium]|nr:prohibitin family protein [Anaerolineales bacterium]
MLNFADVFKGIATFVWLIAVGLVVLAVVRASRGRPLKGAVSLIIGVVIAAVLLTLISAGLVFIQPDERGVVVSPYDSQGYRTSTLGPGLHWVIPGEQVVVYSISRQTYTMSVITGSGDLYDDDSIRARTRDGQEIFVDASVIYQIDPDQVISLHIDWQRRYQDEVVRPLTRGIIRDAASQYGVEEIVSTQRATMEIFITDALALKLAENDLILIDFVLRDIHFSEEYAAAVEQKQIAEQQALQAQLVVEQRRQEAEQARQVAQGQADAAVIAAEGAAEARLIEAEAEAEALRMIAAALADNPDMLTYLYIDKLSPNVEVMFLPSDAPFIFPLPGTTAP